MQFPVVGYISPTHPLTYSKEKFGKFRQGAEHQKRNCARLGKNGVPKRAKSRVSYDLIKMSSPGGATRYVIICGFLLSRSRNHTTSSLAFLSFQSHINRRKRGHGDVNGRGTGPRSWVEGGAYWGSRRC